VSLAKFSTVRVVKPAMFVESVRMVLPSQMVLVYLVWFQTALRVLQLLVVVYVLVSINLTLQAHVSCVRLLARLAIVMVLVLLAFLLSILYLQMVLVSLVKIPIAILAN